MKRARARHILVNSKEICQELKEEIENGADFAALAKDISECPSGHEGGDLGEFSPGQMVKSFDKVVFSGEIGKIYGPIKTEFGYHLIEILSLTEDD